MPWVCLVCSFINDQGRVYATFFTWILNNFYMYINFIYAMYLFVLFILEGQQWLLQGSPKIGMGGDSLEISGSKLGEPVLSQILFCLWYRYWGQCCIGMGEWEHEIMASVQIENVIYTIILLWWWFSELSTCTLHTIMISGRALCSFKNCFRCCCNVLYCLICSL